MSYRDITWYFGTPYSKWATGEGAPIDEGLERAFEEAARQAAVLFREGYKLYAPIPHSHPIAKFGKIDPLDHSIWLPSNEWIIDLCGGMILCKMEKWEISVGLDYEVKRFRAASKPVVYMTPGFLPPGF